MLELSVEQIFNVYTLQTYLIYKNCRLFLIKYDYRLYCEISKVRRLNN